MTRPQVLLIDDDRKLSRLLVNFLDQEGFDVSAAYTGAEGLMLAKAQRWDLVLLDVMLPVIDGHQVLEQLRAYSEVPVLMLTGRAGEEDLVAGFERGADDYLSKTASSRELSMRMRALLRRSGGTFEKPGSGNDRPSGDLRLGALRVELDAKHVFVDGRAANLTSVEFELLLILLSHKGQICTRDSLLKSVRGRAYRVADRAIDVHVASLRKKLGDDARTARFIRTVRSAGYLLVDPENPARE